MYQRFKEEFNRRQILAIVLIMAIILLVIIWSIRAYKNSENNIPNILDNVEQKTAQIDKYYVYGNHLGMTGSIENVRDVTDLSLVLRNTSGDETEYKIPFVLTDTGIAFYLSEYLNEGLYLDAIPHGNYYVLLKVYTGDLSDYYTPENETAYTDSIDYYTVTKNHHNNKVTISFDEYQKLNYMNIKVEAERLPEDVYDICIDPGHGGVDAGAIGGGYLEKNLNLANAKAIKAELEDRGYKVCLTRDGSENEDAPMGFTMYDKDGRVNVACASKAKYCLAMHMNAGQKGHGLQIYTAVGDSIDFASQMANKITDQTGLELSRQIAYKIADGVYARPFLQSDVESSAATNISRGYDPYPMTTNTTYYFMIRELGGIATGAYMDGRNPSYGTNLYMNSNVGIEAYLCEMGYIDNKENRENVVNNTEKYARAIADAFDLEING